MMFEGHGAKHESTRCEFELLLMDDSRSKLRRGGAKHCLILQLEKGTGKEQTAKEKEN